MQRTGGIMPLPDVYCLYNRARGTELISPDDLLSAVRLFPQVHWRAAGLAPAGLDPAEALLRAAAALGGVCKHREAL